LLRSFAVALGLALGVAGAELALRVLAPQERSWLEIYRADPAPPFVSLAPGVAVTIETREGRWHVYTDARGRRVGRPPADAGGRPELLVLGDSFALGHGVEYEQSFPARAADLLGFAAVDTGVPGYGPTQYREVLESLLASGERPSAVVVSLFLGNDFTDCVSKPRLQVVDGTLVEGASAWRAWLVRNLHTARLIGRVYQRLAASEDALFRDASWKGETLARAYATFGEELARIAELCREARIPVLAVVIPAKASLAPPAEPSASAPDLALPARKAALALETAGIAYVDLTEPLRALGPADAYLARDGHLTPRGNEVAAEEIARALRVQLREATSP